VHLKRSPPPSRDVYSWGLMLMPVIAGVVLLSLEPSVFNVRVLSVVSLATAALIAVDARRWNMPAARYAIATLFLYAGYPWYLRARTKHGAPSMLLAGLLASAFMFVSLYVAGGTLSSVVPHCALVAGGHAVCDLENRGIGPGGSCFSLELVHPGGRARSQTICSKTVWPNKTAKQEFKDALPMAPELCAGGCKLEARDVRWR
jgi:hypothetical protein